MDLATILDDCLHQLKTGETLADCLARYPGHAAELAPMLDAAMQVRVLGQQRLSDGQRLRGKVMLREALANQSARRSWLATLSGSRPMRGLVTAAVVLLFVILTGSGVVAASRPGDPAYPVRVMLERVPVLLQITSEGRAQAELHAVGRRLMDLQTYLEESGQVSNEALDALLIGYGAAAAHGAHLPDEQRFQIANRLQEHAQIMTHLSSREPQPHAVHRLRSAAQQVNAIAERLRPGGSHPADPSTSTPPDPQAGDERPGGGPFNTPTRTPRAGQPTIRPPDSRPDGRTRPAPGTPTPGQQPVEPSRPPGERPTEMRPVAPGPSRTRVRPSADPGETPTATIEAETVAPAPTPTAEATRPGPRGTRPPDPQHTPPGNSQPSRPRS
ncbi:MAG: hypothetical protein U9R25_09730 [Chloroflexota bacterium]|nr:hypothetical protein [Chloroflexota bacterium]